MLRLTLLAFALSTAGCSCGGAPTTDAGTDVPAALDAPDLDAPALDTPDLDAPVDTGASDAPIDAGPRCPACPGAVVRAMRAIGVPGFTATCPAGQVVDFAGTMNWTGPGSDLVTRACASDTSGPEASFYVCCEPAADAGSDAGIDGGLGDGAPCDPSADGCGPGLACCYPCGIPGCAYACEPACSSGDPGCFDGCLLRP